MELDSDLRKLVTDFGRARSLHQASNTKIRDLEGQMKAKDEKLVNALETVDRLRKDSVARKCIEKLLDEQIRMIPDYKKKLGELLKTVDQYQTTLDDKNEEINRMKLKYLQDISDLQGQIVVDRRQDREAAEKRMKDLEEFLNQTQKDEIKGMEKQAEGERLNVEEKFKGIHDMMENMEAEHKAEIQTMKVKLAVSTKAANHSTPTDTEIYSKKMLEMKKHYEGQLIRMAEELKSSKEVGGGNKEVSAPKKKVRFDQSKDIIFSPSPEAVEEADPPPKPLQQHLPSASQYQSLFQGATNKFSNPSAGFSKTAVTRPFH